MRKSCGVCGNSFEAKRAAAKYCGEVCRKRAQRQPGGVKAADVAPTPPAADEPSPEPGPTAAATTAELERADRLNTAIGQAALVLAKRIDASSTETGGSLASLVREHRATMAEALRDTDGQADPLDELRTRRERKLSSG